MSNEIDFYIHVIQQHNNILVSGYKDGIKVFKKLPYKPSLYIETKNPSIYKTINNINLEKKEFDDILSFYRFLRDNKDISNLKLYGNDSIKYQWLSDNFPGVVNADYNKFRKVFIDIETCCELGFPEPSRAPEPINALTYYDSILKKYYVLTDKTLGEVTINDDECELIQCENEYELLYKFITIWRNNFPDIISGWNTRHFDIPYIMKRIEKVLGENYIKKLSPFDIVTAKEVATDRGNKEIVYDIAGISELDYLELYKKFSYGEKPSYSLKYITTLELGETKLDHEEFANMHLFYKENYQKFIEYNIQDVKLITKLDEKLKMINLAAQIGYIAKINFKECFSPVMTWEALIYNDLKSKNIFSQIIKKESSSDGGYAGAFVKQPIPNRYKWVVSFDLNSLYPSLIRQFNISPEKLIPSELRNKVLVDIKNKNINDYNVLSNIDFVVDAIINQTIDTEYFKKIDVSLAGSGYMFKRDSKGFMPSIMETIYNQRRSVKKEMLKHEELVEELKTEIHSRGLKI